MKIEIKENIKVDIEKAKESRKLLKTKMRLIQEKIDKFCNLKGIKIRSFGDPDIGHIRTSYKKCKYLELESLKCMADKKNRYCEKIKCNIAELEECEGLKNKLKPLFEQRSEYEISLIRVEF